MKVDAIYSSLKKLGFNPNFNKKMRLK